MRWSVELLESIDSFAILCAIKLLFFQSLAAQIISTLGAREIWLMSTFCPNDSLEVLLNKQTSNDVLAWSRGCDFSKMLSSHKQNSKNWQ